MGYHKLDDKTWDDEKFRRLSPIAKLLWLNLLSGPSKNFIGFYILRPHTAMEHISCDKPKDFESYLDEILKLDMALYDPENRVILIKNFLHYNPIGGDKKPERSIKPTQKASPHQITL